jgi:hypothetical protein
MRKGKVAFWRVIQHSGCEAQTPSALRCPAYAALEKYESAQDMRCSTNIAYLGFVYDSTGLSHTATLDERPRVCLLMLLMASLIDVSPLHASFTTAILS